MPGTWPNLDGGESLTRIRTYVNETTAGFFTDAELYRNLSIAAKEIAQKSGCIKRILDAQTTSGTRTVTTNVYNVEFVEYIPSDGSRPFMLGEIDPLKCGHFPLDGTYPQYWYKFGDTIGIEPIPDGTYNLRLYCSDIPKVSALSFSSFSPGSGAAQWTTGSTLQTCTIALDSGNIDGGHSDTTFTIGYDGGEA